MSKIKRTLSEETKNEIERFEREIVKLEAGETDPDDFKRFRLNNGTYGIRFSDDKHMIRIKIPYGLMTSDQLDTIASIAEKYTPTKLSHITTRQAIQIHNMHRRDVPAILRELNEVGLTTREACGNTVRNVSCDELAGICDDEVFNPIPYADLVFRFFLRNPLCQNLPRKFKIAFEGSQTSDRARINIHDLGFRSCIRTIKGKEVRGFITSVGGGLGSIPFPAKLLEEFTPAELLLPTTEAVIRLHDRFGERKDRNRARIKYLVAKWGIEEFRKVWLNERRAVIALASGNYEKYKIEWNDQEKAPKISGTLIPPKDIRPGFDLWRDTNVIQHQIKDHSAIYVRCYLGDATPEQAREIAQLAREFGGGRLRTTITQNLVMSCVPDKALQTVYSRLHMKGMGLAHAQYIADITRCPGADTCNLAVTHSKGVAQDVTEKVFSNGYAEDPVFKNIKIKISGCTNSCGQHHIADIGLFGSARSFNGKTVAHYTILVGGRTGVSLENSNFGMRAGIVAARRIHEAIKHLLDLYKADKKSSESFSLWTDRKGKDYFKEKIAPFQNLDEYKDDPKIYEDLGDEGKAFQVRVGKGECAA